jgi:hypothetical protein
VGEQSAGGVEVGVGHVSWLLVCAVIVLTPHLTLDPLLTREATRSHLSDTTVGVLLESASDKPTFMSVPASSTASAEHDQQPNVAIPAPRL